MKTIEPRGWLSVIILIAFTLRLFRLDFQPLWWDEGYSVFFATRDFWTMIERTALDIHPPFYYALMQVWIAFAGKSDAALRLLSVVIGTATIPLLYALARKLFTDPRLATIAALLLAVSPFHIYYSQEIRMYGLVTLLGLASVYFTVQLLGMTPGTRQSVTVAPALILSTVAALYTQYYAAFILVAEIILILAIYLIIDRRPLDWRSLKSLWTNPLFHWLDAWIAISALYLPWVIYAGPKLYTYVTTKVGIEKYAPLDPLTFFAQHLSALAVGHLTEWSWLAWASVVLIALVVFAIASDARKRDAPLAPFPLLSLSPSLLVLLSLLVPLLLGYLVNLIFPFHPAHSERLLLLAAPAFYLIASIGIVRLWNQRARFGIGALFIVTIICAASLYDFYTVPRYPNDDYRSLIAEMQSTAQPGDVVLAIYPWQIGYLETYYRGAPLNIIETPNDAWIQNPARMQNDLDTMLKPNTRVWIPALQTQGRLIEEALDAHLRARAYSVVDQWHGTTRLELFAFADDPPRANRPLALENDLALANWGITTEPNMIRVWFDANKIPAGAYKASIRLVDAKGNIWAQDDREIGGALQRIGLAIPLGTPPGEYAARLQVYRARDGKPLRDEEILASVKIIAPAQPNLAAITNRTEIDFGNGIRLRGVIPPAAAKPGIPATITFLWQATRAIDREYQVEIQIRDTFGNIFASIQAMPARGIYPTTRWQTNEIVRDLQTITLRGNTPNGDYRVIVILIDVANNARVKSIDVGSINVKGRPHYFGAPSPSFKADARFGTVAQLVGYDFSNQRIVLYWRAIAATETSYKVFLHLIDHNGKLITQRDQIPGAGALPTTSWVAGEYLVDVYDIDAPPGEYTIRIGMYDPATNLRLPVLDLSNLPIGDHRELSTRFRSE